MSKHTVTPWRVRKMHKHFAIESAAGVLIATVRYSGRPDGSTSAEEAAHIVRCVNNFDALVEALESMLALRAATLRSEVMDRPEREIVADAQRALAAVKGDA